ncbi:MAG TPA: serine hydrolase domain-containing protein [Pyrinomonadaceae bacterium]|nr:serine hydrolase domain-containing protein [Pyrinomonadaceae bacterium]
MKADGTVGLSVGFIKDDFVWTKGFGYADLENKVPAKAESAYRLTSVTNPMTAVAVLQLAEPIRTRWRSCSARTAQRRHHFVAAKNADALKEKTENQASENNSDSSMGEVDFKGEKFLGNTKKFQFLQTISIVILELNVES